MKSKKRVPRKPKPFKLITDNGGFVEYGTSETDPYCLKQYKLLYAWLGHAIKYLESKNG